MMILSPNFALITASYFNPIVVPVNEICSILLWLVSADLSISDMDIWLAIFLPYRVVSDGFGILPRYDLKRGIYAILFLAISFFLSQFYQFDCMRFHFVWSIFDQLFCLHFFQFVLSRFPHYYYYLYLRCNKLIEDITLYYFYSHFSFPVKLDRHYRWFHCWQCS